MKQRNIISLETVNAGKIIEIDPVLIAQAKRRIRNAMIPIVREHKLKQAQSLIDARKLIFNA